MVGIFVGDRPITEPLARLAELAESLGADPDLVADAQATFDASSDDLRAAIEGNPGVRVVAASGTPQEMYVAYPPGFPELRYYQDLGMDLVVPEEHPTQDGYWETLSWEEADKYPVDLVLADARGGTVDDILEQLPATARALPAIEAGQITAWPTVQAYGYGNVAANLDSLTEAVSRRVAGHRLMAARGPRWGSLGPAGAGAGGRLGGRLQRARTSPRTRARRRRRGRSATFPVDIAHRHGTTTVAEEPERIVTVGLTDQDALLALGVVPVGVDRVVRRAALGGLAVGDRRAGGARRRPPRGDRRRAGDRVRGHRRPPTRPDPGRVLRSDRRPSTRP